MRHFPKIYPLRFVSIVLLLLAIPAAATTYYVNVKSTSPTPPYSSWNTASTNIQSAVNLAQTGDTVLVTNGFYSSGYTINSGVSNRVVATNAIILQSVNGPATTFIVGSSTIQGIFLTNGPVVSGFTITNALLGIYVTSTNILVTNCCITHCFGRGVVGLGGRLENCVLAYNSGGGAADIYLDNCIITNNTAYYGGGVYGSEVNNFTACILNHCLLANNHAYSTGGGAFQAQINNSMIISNSCDDKGGGVCCGLINNCTFIGNSAVYGGGAENFGVTCTLNNCTLTNNTAQYNGGGANDCTLNQCILSQNTVTAGAGGGADNSRLYNCIIVSNIATAGLSQGGGACECNLTNCLLANNVGLYGGGADGCALVGCTVTANSTSTIGGYGGIIGSPAENCIIYDNIGGDYDQSMPLNYCCTPVLATNGIGNITNAPLFVNPSAGDFHLQPNSPCINSGENAYNTSATDLDGNPRIAGGTVDIGAYECQTPSSVISYAYLQQYNLPTDGSADFADLDGSGFNVYQDWIASLNPTNPASVLAMLPPAATNLTSGLTISWQSVGGIPYLLQRSTNLSAPFTTLQNITGQAGTTSYTDTTATNPAPYFYRVGVSR